MKTAAVLSVFVLLVSGLPVQAEWNVTQLTDNDDSDTCPQVSGSNVV